MEFAIIVKKRGDGSIDTLRSTLQPPTSELTAEAKQLDAFLGKEIPLIEKRLIRAGLLNIEAPTADSKQSTGNVLLWSQLGSEIGKVCDKYQIHGRRERRWLWEAIENLYATGRIKRAQRGRTRNHFEYCYRLSRYPKSVAARLNWSEWVYFFDSPTVREEVRADEWLMRKAKRFPKNIERRLFRRFTEALNRRIKKMDTSVLEKDELFEIYDSVWNAVRKELRATARQT